MYVAGGIQRRDAAEMFPALHRGDDGVQLMKPVMTSRLLQVGLLAAFSVGPFACSAGASRLSFEDDEVGSAVDPASAEPSVPANFGSDAGPVDSDESSFEACASSTVEAEREQLPVDIIWIVDNSVSMRPAVEEVQAGLNAFANLIDAKGIDYKVVMLSKRGVPPTNGSASSYPVCIPPPLGGADCANGPRFFHASLDVKSTQPLEQFLGTLGQTPGYTSSDSRGSEPWSQELRPNATKSIVIVTDDNSRFSATSFETFPGGKNPNNSTTLPAGLLHPSRGGQFDGYMFSGIYGWGSETVPSERCSYPNGARPASSGEVYTDLVTKTGGVRAKICDGSAAWGPFFDDVAAAVIATARIACEFDVPEADGALDSNAVNVTVANGTNPPVVVPRVASSAECGALEGWYYDDPKDPSKVLLCPISCDAAQSKGGTTPPKVEILFGCESLIR